MGQEVAAKECHKWFGERQKPFTKSLECGFEASSIADEYNNKIDEVVLAKAGAGKTHLFLDGFEHTHMAEHLSYHSYFSHPRRRRGPGFGSNLDCYHCLRHTGWCPPCLERDQQTFSILRRHISSVLRQFPSLTVQLCNLVAHPVGRQFQGSVRARSPASCGAIPEGTRVDPLRRENPHDAY